MRIKLIILFIFMTLVSFAQEVEKDFDAPDSLYREDQFYLNITYNTLQQRPDGLKQNKLSPGFALGFLRDMPLNKKRTVSLAAGLGYSLAIYNQNMGISRVGSETSYSILNTDGVTFSKDKLALHYVEVPVEFRWRNSTPESHKFWRVHLGIKMGYLFYSQYKLQSSQGNSNQTNLADLSDLHYGVYLTTGWNTWNLYAYYGLNPLFQSSAKIDGQSIDMNTANFGIMFYIL